MLHASEKGGHEAVCQQECWALKNGGLEGGPHRLEKGASASDDAGPEKGNGL